MRNIDLPLERPERDDFGQERETVLLAHLAMWAARDGYRCLAQSLLNVRRVAFNDPGEYLGDRVEIGVDRASSHWVLLQHLDVVARYAAAATGKGLVDLRLVALRADLLRMLVTTTPWCSSYDVAGSGPCRCRVCAGSINAPVGELPVHVITGRPARSSESFAHGAMRRDLKPILDAGGVRVHSVGFSDLGAAAEEARGILLGLARRMPGVVLFARGGDLQAEDYLAFRSPLEEQLSALVAEGWTVGAAMGHSHPQQGRLLRLEWDEPTASLAADRLLGYRRLMGRRVELHRQLREAITKVGSCPMSGEPADYGPDGTAYVEIARELTEVEFGLPAPFLRTLRRREAPGLGDEVVQAA